MLVIGGGRMGEALLAGLVAAGRAPGSLAVVEPDPVRRAELSARFAGVHVGDELVRCDSAVVAVKPPDAPAVCAALAPLGPQRVLSIAAGVTTSQLEAALGGDVAVVRAMPNTPAQVGAGASAVAPGAHASEADLGWAEELLGSVGVVVRVEEEQLDAVTGLSGSGPAYVFLLVEALIDAGVREGLDPAVAGELVVQTVAGAARLLGASGASGTDAADHRVAVTSPQGTTAAGLAVLEERAVRDAVVAAVAAATERSRQLGGG